MGFFDDIADGASSVFGGIGDFATGIVNKAGDVVDTGLGVFKNIGGGFGNLLNGLGSLGPMILIGVVAAVVLPKLLDRFMN